MTVLCQGLGITHVVNTAEGDGVASVKVDRKGLEENGEDEKDYQFDKDWAKAYQY